VKLGILSDTHDRGHAFAKAVDALRRAGAEYYIHCGDVGSPDMLDHLAGLPAAFVYGNNDYDHTALERYARDLDLSYLGPFGQLTLADKQIGVLHGDDPRLKRKLLADQSLDYLLQGHTHLRADERVGRTRVINPGALHRAAEKSVALLDLTTDDLRFIVLDV
jgi:putative phosphoesterase